MLITNSRHYILKAAHPSPLSAYRGFFGCKHFSKVNEILGDEAIDWQIENIDYERGVGAGKGTTQRSFPTMSACID
jgi:uracil-DNA glycosylase